ncbi:N-acetylmuramoyl-L-alanine amidase [Maritimibacter sp. DP4N28-5]|uniref:N-acetylmuramoyl-L-alanine amidase n=2 Tax=Maritimibacter dapengensis TaxID=2836868 RepID=A0ABS6T4R8_9RHOB|nr:N-acetylmuramoyl-L-alanine amidase [Maritimibacter dapengensis]
MLRLGVFLFMMMSAPGLAQQLTGLARLSGDGVSVTSTEASVEIGIPMTQAVPWRVFTLADPPRLVVDFSELDWGETDGEALVSTIGSIVTMQTGLFRPGWSRMVLTLSEPLAVDTAAMRREGEAARVDIRLIPTDPEHFAAKAGAPASALFKAAPIALQRDPRGTGPLVVVLDPGHGGLDPGAEKEGVREADLMLTFARELKDVLLRSDGVDVVLTRDEDVFVPLEERVSIARAAGADLFISLHADALAQGRANGATVYTLSEDATDIASQKLAERHDRSDLLAGVDLSETGDEVALVLMDMARTETDPRSDALADALVQGIFVATGSTYKTPRMEAGFSVLKAPDIPSVLVELGFLSSKRDREKLVDPDWRRSAAEGMRDAILSWAEADAAAAERLRQ